MRDTETPMTAAIARELWAYDPQTGELRWRVSRPNGVKPGSLAGSPTGEGALMVGVTLKGKRRLYLVHRLAWLMVTGAWPSALLHHRNGVKQDNRWGNLRDANPTVHAQNRRRPSSRNRTGFLGVSFNKGRYVARIVVDKKQITLGRFTEPEPAHQAYLKAKREHHVGCTI